MTLVAVGATTGTVLFCRIPAVGESLAKRLEEPSDAEPDGFHDFPGTFEAVQTAAFVGRTGKTAGIRIILFGLFLLLLFTSACARIAKAINANVGDTGGNP